MSAVTVTDVKAGQVRSWRRNQLGFAAGDRVVVVSQTLVRRAEAVRVQSTVVREDLLEGYLGRNEGRPLVLGDQVLARETRFEEIL